MCISLTTPPTNHMSETQMLASFCHFKMPFEGFQTKSICVAQNWHTCSFQDLATLTTLSDFVNIVHFQPRQRWIEYPQNPVPLLPWYILPLAHYFSEMLLSEFVVHSEIDGSKIMIKVKDNVLFLLMWHGCNYSLHKIK